MTLKYFLEKIKVSFLKSIKYNFNAKNQGILVKTKITLNELQFESCKQQTWKKQNIKW